MAFLLNSLSDPPAVPERVDKKERCIERTPSTLTHFDSSRRPFHFFFYISWLCLSRSSTPSSCLPFKVEEDCFSSIDPDSSLSDASFAAV